MSHTPGPWYLNGDCIEADGPAGPRDLTVATAVRFLHPWCDLDDSRAEWEANARLIAAAPDLLAACKAMAHDLRAIHFTDGEYRLTEDAARQMVQFLERVVSKATEGR